MAGRPFVVIAAQRTGSTLLVRSLDSSPHILCAGELFHVGPRVHHAEFAFDPKLLGSAVVGRAIDGLFPRWRVGAFVRRFMNVAGSDVSAVGFKVMTSQLRRFRAVLPILVELGAARLFLLRRDVFATAISQLKARATGLYHSDRAAGATGSFTITGDVQEFRSLLDRCETSRREILALHAKFGGKLLAYEDMVADWDGFFLEVGRELGIGNLRIAAALDKLGTRGPQVHVENERILREEFAKDDSRRSATAR